MVRSMRTTFMEAVWMQSHARNNLIFFYLTSMGNAHFCADYNELASDCRKSSH